MSGIGLGNRGKVRNAEYCLLLLHINNGMVFQHSFPRISLLPRKMIIPPGRAPFSLWKLVYASIWPVNEQKTMRITRGGTAMPRYKLVLGLRGGIHVSILPFWDAKPSSNRAVQQPTGLIGWSQLGTLANFEQARSWSCGLTRGLTAKYFRANFR